MRDDIIYDNIEPLSEKGRQSMEWLFDILFPPMRAEEVRDYLEYITRYSVATKEDADE